MSCDKTRVISRAVRSSFFLLPFSLLIMHGHIQTCCGIRIQSKATTTRELVAVWFPVWLWCAPCRRSPFSHQGVNKRSRERLAAAADRWTDRDPEDFDRNRYVCKLDADGYITQRQTNFFLENVHRSISADYRIKYTTDRFARSIRSHFFQFLGSAWALTFI